MLYYECPRCGLVINRDHNGSINILEERLKAVGRHSRVIPEAHGCKPWGVVTKLMLPNVVPMSQDVLQHRAEQAPA